MKKSLYIKLSVLFLVLAFSCILPKISSAQSNSDLQAEIQQLLAQVQQLQAQLASIQGTGQWCHTFTNNLSIGNSGTEVTALQTVLQKDGEQITVSNSFDDQTASAVTGFQQKYTSDILTPNGLQYGTGYAGKSTRAKLNSLYGCGTTPVTPITQTSPYISYVQAPAGDTNVIYPGEKATIYGSGFPANSTVTVTLNADSIMQSIPNISGQVNSDGSQVVFIAPTDVAVNYGVYVTTSNGFTTNSVNVTTCDTMGCNEARPSNSSNTPSISSISPTSATMGSTVYVYGTNFGQNTIVAWDGDVVNGEPTITPTIISATSLSFVIPSYISVGNHTIELGNSVVDNGMSNSVSLNVVASYSSTTTTQPSLSVSPASGQAPLTVTASFNGCIQQLTWGDGAVWNSGYAMESCGAGTSQYVPAAPSHTYTTPGTYTIQLQDDPYTTQPINVQKTVTVTASSSSTTTTQPSISVSQNPALGNQSAIVGTTNVKIGSYVLSAGNAENVRLTNLTLNAGSGIGLQNLNIRSSGVQIGTTVSSVSGGSGTSYTFPTSLLIPAGTSMTLDVYADVATAGTMNPATMFTGCSAFGANDNVAVSCNSVQGQSLTVTGTGTTSAQPTIIASQNSVLGAQTATIGENNVKIGSYILSAGPTEDVKIMNVTITTNTGITPQNLRIMSDGMQIGQMVSNTSGGATYTFPASITVPAGTTKTFDVYGDVASVWYTTRNSPATTLGCSAFSAISNTAISCNSAQGQSITIAVGSLGY